MGGGGEVDQACMELFEFRDARPHAWLQQATLQQETHRAPSQHGPPEAMFYSLGVMARCKQLGQQAAAWQL